MLAEQSFYFSDYGGMGSPDYSGIQTTEGKIRGIGNKIFA